MINNIFTNIVYQEFREKVNIKLLKIEDLIFNNIFINCTSVALNEDGKFEFYHIEKSSGLIKLTRKNLIEDYEIEDKSHFSRITKLNFSRIKEHFKKMYAELNITFEDNALYIKYKINKEYWGQLLNIQGTANIPITFWKKINNAKIMNTFTHLIAYSHKKHYVQVDFIQQMIDITKVDKKNVATQLNRTVETLKKIGIVIILDYNNTTNSTRTKYDNLEVVIKYSKEYKMKQTEPESQKKQCNNDKRKDKAKCDNTDKEKFDKLNDNTPLADDEVEEF